jgi:hypothetical protein
MRWEPVKRVTFAINYVENERPSVAMVGTQLQTTVSGRAEVDRGPEGTRVRILLGNLRHPQTLGVNYTCYVVWAIDTRGQAGNVGRLPFIQDSTSENPIRWSNTRAR